MILFSKLTCLIIAITNSLAITTTSDPSSQISRKRSEQSCKCTSNQTYWPSSDTWNTLNDTVSGKLIATQPVAISCYPGPLENQDTCSIVVTSWTNASFQALQPLGLDYPINNTCPPVNHTAGQNASSCSLGNSPVYAVNATSTDDVSAALVFASQHNIRVVIKTTGHDLLGRSDGYGSLEIWLRYLRNGIEFQPSLTPNLPSCPNTTWNGNTIKISGGYTWSDVYPIAQSHNVIVVGGGTPTVSCVGGWMSGGGHGPASRQFGLGADQVLEAKVVLANGTLVTANACENTELFFALRGGGAGTYGVVVATTVKAWPERMVGIQGVAVQHLAIAPLTTDDTDALLDAVAILWAAYPDLNDAGYAGYGSWSIETSSPLFADFYAGYVHGIYMFNRSIEDARDAFASVRARLAVYNGTSLFVSETYVSYPDYWTFYWAESGVEPPIGTSSALGSRLVDRKAVQSNATALREAIGVIAGGPGQFTFNSLELVSGGQVFADADDATSGVLPAWRECYFNNIVSRAYPTNSDAMTRDVILDDITDVKIAALKALAPGTGVYMNEGDRLDPDFEVDFYGVNYARFRETKGVYDPGDVFYCPTCVGSAEWVVREDGALCRV